MNKIKTFDICVIGAGRLGTTVGCILAGKKSPGVSLKALASRTTGSLNRAEDIMGDDGEGVVFTMDNKKAASLADCVLICTPDDTIENVCSEVFTDKTADFRSSYALHFSGSKSLSVLDSAKNAGAEVASAHPLKSFASIKEAIKTLPGTIFGVTYCSEKSKKIANLIVESLGGSTIKVDDSKKALYHAAACVASNYLVALINYAVLIHKKIGINKEESLKGLMGLAEGTVENIKRMGTEKSLTGPIARGDLGTIREHMKNFNKYFDSNDIDLYKVMGIETSKIAYNNKWIDKKTVEKIKRILSE